MRLLVAIVGLAATLYILWLGFDFLRDRSVNKWVIAVTAVIWGVGGSLALYYLVNSIVESLPDRLSRILQPYVFVGPAVGILIWYLALPVVRTFRLSLLDRNSQAFVGLENYIAVFTERQMRQAFLNNIAWILVGATLVVLFGLIVALLADRSTWERFAKAMIFLPMAISMVGAAIIWQFMYIYRDISAPQIGLVNAIVVALGGEPQRLVATPLACQQSLPNRDCRLASGGLRHDALLRRHQGHPGRFDGGRPSGRRQRMASAAERSCCRRFRAHSLP